MIFLTFSRSMAVSAILVLYPMSATFAQSPQEDIVKNWLRAADGVDFLTVNYNGIRYDAASDITSISDLTLSFEVDGAKISAYNGQTQTGSTGRIEYTLTFPLIEFDNLSLDNGYYSARSITADIVNLKFDVDAEPNSSSSATGTYKNMVVNNVDWSQLPEISDAIDRPISKYFPVVEALTDVSFDSASLGGMTMNQSTGNPAINLILSYGASTIGKTIRGDFSSMVVDGMVMTIRASDDMPAKTAAMISTDVSIGEMTITDYNFGTLLRKFAPGATSAEDTPYDTAIGKMAVNELRINAAGGGFSLDRLVLSDVGIRSPGVSVLDEFDRLFQLSNSEEQKPDGEEIVALIADIYGAFRLGEFEMAGLRVNAPGAVQGKMDLYRVSDLSSAGLGEFLLKGINFAGGRGEYFNLDSFSISDIGFPSLDALLNLEAAGKNNDIAAIMRAIPTLGSYRSSGLEIRVPGQGAVSLIESRIEMDKFIGPIPTDIELAVNGLKFPVAMMEGDARQIFTEMGFKDVVVSYRLDANWDRDTKVLALDLATWLKNGGELKAELDIGGIPKSVFENPLTAQQAIGFLTVNGANIQFNDQSIVNKGMTIVAAKQGVDVATLKAQAVGLLPFALQMLNNPDFVNELSDAVKQLLDRGGSITASATPSAPVSVMQLIGVGATAPGAIIDLMNVKVKAE